MSFDPSRCNLVATPFPTDHLLSDASVPDPLEAIQDCSVFDIPTLFPEGPCPTILTTSSVVHFQTSTGDSTAERLSVNQATEECVFGMQFDLNPPCLIVAATGRFNYVPFSSGVDARLTFKTVEDDTDSSTIHNSCYLGLFLDIDIPAQPCPTIVAGSSVISVLPPGETPSLVVTVTQTDESLETSCAFRVDLDLQVPCTGVEIEGSDVGFDSGGGAPPNGSLRVVTLSAVPCQFDFQVLLDLSSVAFDPLTAPAITNFCLNPLGKLQSAEVTYYTWPGGDVAYTLWRSQFGYCDENGCFATPLDFGLHNTGCDSDNHALSDSCQDDPHWLCEGVATQSMAYSAYPTVWLRPGRRSRWIAKTCSGIEDSGVTQTFSTTFTIPIDVSPVDFALEGVLDADNWVTEIRVNGVAVPIHRLTDVFPGSNDYELRGPMYRFLLNSHFVVGTNTVEFDVNSSDFIGPDLPSWLGFRVEWTGVAACNARNTTTTTTSTTSTTPGPTTTTTTSTTPTPSSTTSTTPIPGDCACHFHLGDTIEAVLELQNTYLGPCYLSSQVGFCNSETGIIWFTVTPMCVINAQTGPIPNCGLKIDIQLYKTLVGGITIYYEAWVYYRLYPYAGSTSTPYFTAAWHLPLRCPGPIPPSGRCRLSWNNYGLPPSYTLFNGPSLAFCPNEAYANIVKLNSLTITKLS